MNNSSMPYRVIIYCFFLIQLVSCTQSEPYRPPLRYSFVVSTLAGNGQAGWADGIGGAAKFNEPRGILRDSVTGNFYVADSHNHMIRTVTPDGKVTTFVGKGDGAFADGVGRKASFNIPVALAFGAGGVLYVADEGNNMIRKVTRDSVVTRIAGRLLSDQPTTPGPALQRDIPKPEGIAVDSKQNIYVAEFDKNQIVKISPSGWVSVFCGGPTTNGGFSDAPAMFYNPSGLAIDGQGYMFVADWHNHRIRKIRLADSSLTTPLGSGNGAWVNGVGTAASFNNPYSLTFDATGNLYVADWENRAIRKILMPALVVQTFAGAPTRPPYVDGIAESKASFKNPAGIAMDPEGNFYVTDPGNHCIRKITLLRR